MLAKGLKKEAVEVTIEPRRLRVATSSGEGEGGLPGHGGSLTWSTHLRLLLAGTLLLDCCRNGTVPLSTCTTHMHPAGQKEYELDLALHGEVDPCQSRFEVLGTKVEIRLRKVEAQPWPQLEQGSSAQQQGQGQAAAEATAAAEAAATPAAGVADASTAAAAAPQQPSAARPYAG